METIGRDQIHPGAVQPIHLASQFFKFTRVISTPGPLNVSGTYKKDRDDSLMVFWLSGSGFSNTGTGLIRVNVKHDGVLMSELIFFINTLNEHNTLVPRCSSLSNVPRGQHTVTFENAGIVTDSNDFFYCYALELPKGYTPSDG
jgi:hypothetical protein